MTRQEHATHPIQGHLTYRRMAIEVESPEQLGYEKIKYNLTESSVTDTVWDELDLDLKGLVLCYGDHLGNPALREQVAGESSAITTDQVLVTAGAAAALFIINTTLLSKGDHMIVAHPNYITNVETPRALGADVSLLPLRFEEGWRITADAVARLLRPETKLVSLTSPHNPTGSVLSEKELRAILALVEEKGCYLLMDETYRDMAFGKRPPLAASLSPRAISVSSLSKAYGLPGIRIGWLITQSPELQEAFLAAKEQIFICGSVVDEEIAARFLAQKATFLPKIQAHTKTNFEIVHGWMERNPAFEWVEPRGGTVCFPRIKEGIDLDIDRFYRFLNDKYKTFVGPGHWFEMNRRYMRIGFGWPSKEALVGGLSCITQALEEARD